MIRVIKYTEITKTAVPLMNDRAMTDFRGFLEIGSVHVGRVDDVATIDVLDEVLDTLKSALQTRRKVVTSR